MNKNSNFLLKNGFFHIFTSGFINKIIGFLTSIVLVRILSKDLYGSWSYALNILQFFLLIQGIGVVYGTLQYSSEAKEEEKKLSFFKYGLRIGIIVNVVISLAIILYTIFFDLPIKGSRNILQLLFLFPVVSIIFDMLQIYLRSLLKNKQFAYLSNVNSITFFLFSIIGGILFNVLGIISGKYLSYIVSIFFGYLFLREQFTNIKSVPLPNKYERIEFLKFSIISSLNNSISSLLYLLDTFLVGLFIQNQLVIASYKTATLIPFNLNFIPSTIMTFAYPYFAKYSDDKVKIKHYFVKMQKYLLIINLLISMILIIFAPIIIKVLFGAKYLDSVTVFRIFSFGYFIAGTFRIPSGNILASMKKIKINFYNSIISGIINIVLDIVLIINFQAEGAAIATVIVFVISSIISNYYLYKYLNN